MIIFKFTFFFQLDINSFFFGRYYEGQLTHLTEADAEEMEDKKQLQTTNAVDKVCIHCVFNIKTSFISVVGQTCLHSFN